MFSNVHTINYLYWLTIDKYCCFTASPRHHGHYKIFPALSVAVGGVTAVGVTAVPEAEVAAEEVGTGDLSGIWVTAAQVEKRAEGVEETTVVGVAVTAEAGVALWVAVAAVAAAAEAKAGVWTGGLINTAITVVQEEEGEEEVEARRGVKDAEEVTVQAATVTKVEAGTEDMIEVGVAVAQEE